MVLTPKQPKVVYPEFCYLVRNITILPNFAKSEKAKNADKKSTVVAKHAASSGTTGKYVDNLMGGSDGRISQSPKRHEMTAFLSKKSP